MLGIENTLQENIIGRIGGISLLCLAIACRQGKNLTNVFPAFTALLIFNFFVSFFLYYVKFSLGFQGVILLPAAILHNLIGISLLYVFFKKGIKDLKKGLR